MFQHIFGYNKRQEEFLAFMEEKFGSEYEAWKLKAATPPPAPPFDLDTACELAIARVQEQVSRSYQKWKYQPCSHGAFSRRHVPDVIQTKEFADSWERITSQVIHLTSLTSSGKLDSAMVRMPVGESTTSRFDMHAEFRREMEARDADIKQRLKDELIKYVMQGLLFALLVIMYLAFQKGLT